MSLSFTSSRPAPAATFSPAHLLVSTSFTALTPATSVPHANVLAGTFTPSPSSTPTACQTPNELVIVISTTVTVSQFKQIYHEDIYRFKPRYVVTPDGSLISGPLARNLRESDKAFLWLGGYLVFFTWNSLVALSFIVRATVPDKSIFYILLASQVLALVSWIAQIATALNDEQDCQAAFQAVEVLLALSSSLVLTGVFGLKAYRSLFNSRWVLAGLVLSQAAYVAAVTLRIIKTKTHRRLNGLCFADNPDDLVVVTLASLFLESVFIATCFMVAVWRTSRIVAASGRLSFRQSIFSHLDAPPGPQTDFSDKVTPVPLPTITITRERSDSLLPLTGDKEVMRVAARVKKRRPQTASRYPSTNNRARVVTSSWANRLKEKILDVFTTTRSLHIAMLKPRIQLFREVMRDEMCYTAVLAAASVVSAVLTLVAACNRTLLRQDQWLTFQMAVMSALAVHSLRRVVRRNEYESALLLHDPPGPRIGDSADTRRAARLGSSLGFASIHTANSEVAHQQKAARGSWQWDSSPRASIASSDSGIIDLSRVSIADSASLAPSALLCAPAHSLSSPSPSPMQTVELHV
ncbi:hypothetical protein PENSPDRAFT_2760 [Peniophora sp. CONT]|nr:hypothetical protein PENSPDRAFT_2760 [Peniophora sp. CONT]